MQLILVGSNPKYIQISKKTNVLKYKIVNNNNDKKFVCKNLDLERIKSKIAQIVMVEEKGN